MFNIYLYEIEHGNYLMCKEQIQSIKEGQEIELHILVEPPTHDREASKPSDQYLSWNQDDSLIKAGFKEL